MEVVKPCLAPSDAPPVAEDWSDGVVGPEGGCPAQFDSCLTADANGKMNAYILHVSSWTATTWKGCKPKP